MSNLQSVTDLLPESPQPHKMMMLGALQRGCRNLREENDNLRPLKTELARLRSSLADLFFKNSEKIA